MPSRPDEELLSSCLAGIVHYFAIIGGALLGGFILIRLGLDLVRTLLCVLGVTYALAALRKPRWVFEITRLLSPLNMISNDQTVVRILWVLLVACIGGLLVLSAMYPNGLVPWPQP